MATSIRGEKHQTKTFQNDDGFDIRQRSTDNHSSCLTTVEHEQVTLDDMDDIPLIPSNSQLSNDFDYLFDIIFSPSSVSTSFSGLPSDSSQPSTIEDIDSSSSQSSSPIISKMIFVSHLPITVKCSRLRTFFPGCRKIVSRKNEWDNDIRSAIVEHYTYDDAQRNLSTFSSLASSDNTFRNVKVTYVKKLATKSNFISDSLRAPCSFCDLYVGHIPGSTTKHQLCELFPKAASIDYKQGKTTHNRIKLGYAFVNFVDIKLAAEVMQSVGQYRINDQPLSIFYKALKKYD